LKNGAVIEQRKTVSVVFADLVESTALAESVDVEQLAGILGGYFEMLREAVESHEGTVEKFIGDAVVGVFGVPLLHEDDALRAVRAALDMRAGMDELNARLESTAAVRLALRVGVNTGVVAVTGGGTLGHAINMAARLEQAAQPGQVLVGRETYELAGPSLEAEPVGPLTVKGSSVPVSAWSVRGLREQPARGSTAGSVFVGRESELAAIERALAGAVRDNACVLATVVAPPGLGKSRLIAEAVSHAGPEVRVLSGRCLPYGEGITYAPLVEMVKELERTETVPADIRATIAGTAPVSPEETAWAFRRLFESLAHTQPLIVIVDDLHWADPLLLDLIDYIARSSAGFPILLLCAARPDFFDLRAGWSAPRDRSVLVHLDPLTSGQTDGLLGGLSATGLDADLRRRIIEASGGVPLFVEQMAAFQSESASAGAIPPTIRALLAARVDRLGPRERTVLERAAIEGQTFRRETVLQLMPPAAREEIEPSLTMLLQREFIRRERASNDRQAFAFSHALVRDAVYEAMPRRLRAELHERYGDILEAAAAPPEVIGHHLAAAYEQRVSLGDRSPETSALGVRAGRALHAAGENALARRESRRAINLLRRAEELLRGNTEEWLETVPTLISALVALPDTEAADRLHDQAMATAREHGDQTAELRAEIAWALSGYAMDVAGWQEMATALADRAVIHFETLGAYSDIVDALIVKAYAQTITSASAAIDTLKEARRYAERINDDAAQIIIWDELGGTMLLGDTPYSEAAGFVAEEIRWAKERGFPFSEADAKLSLAYIQAGRGEFDAARQTLAPIRDLFAALAARVTHYGESFMLGGQIERDDGKPAAAEAMYRRAIQAFEQNQPWRRNATISLAVTLLDQRRLDEARAVLDGLLAEEHTDMPRLEAQRLEAEARYRAAVGDVSGGVELARRAVELMDPTDDLVYSARGHETLANLLLAAGDRDAARIEFERARKLFARKGYVPGVQRVLAALRD
jgi:class 3 adenylate cyclase/tetratricopeptide (TPR) repeat protein